MSKIKLPVVQTGEPAPWVSDLCKREGGPELGVQNPHKSSASLHVPVTPIPRVETGGQPLEPRQLTSCGSESNPVSKQQGGGRDLHSRSHM